MADIATLGHGATLAAATSGFEANVDIESMSFGGISAEAIDAGHLGVAAEAADEMGNRPYIFGKIIDAGELTLECHITPGLAIPVGVSDTFTLTWPIFTPGNTTNATWVFSGAIVNASPAIPLEEKITASMTIKISGAITISAEAA